MYTRRVPEGPTVYTRRVPETPPDGPEGYQGVSHRTGPKDTSGVPPYGSEKVLGTHPPCGRRQQTRDIGNRGEDFRGLRDHSERTETCNRVTSSYREVKRRGTSGIRNSKQCHSRCASVEGT